MRVGGLGRGAVPSRGIDRVFGLSGFRRAGPGQGRSRRAPTHTRSASRGGGTMRAAAAHCDQAIGPVEWGRISPLALLTRRGEGGEIMGESLQALATLAGRTVVDAATSHDW